MIIYWCWQVCRHYAWNAKAVEYIQFEGIGMCWGPHSVFENVYYERLNAKIPSAVLKGSTRPKTANTF